MKNVRYLCLIVLLPLSAHAATFDLSEFPEPERLPLDCETPITEHRYSVKNRTIPNTPGKEKSFEAWLNALGARGWQLIETLPSSRHEKDDPDVVFRMYVFAQLVQKCTGGA